MGPFRELARVWTLTRVSTVSIGFALGIMCSVVCVLRSKVRRVCGQTVHHCSLFLHLDSKISHLPLLRSYFERRFSRDRWFSSKYIVCRCRRVVRWTAVEVSY